MNNYPHFITLLYHHSLLYFCNIVLGSTVWLASHVAFFCIASDTTTLRYLQNYFTGHVLLRPVAHMSWLNLGWTICSL